MEPAASEVLLKCTECQACQRYCPFLKKFGLPKEILSELKEEVFFCTNCGACSKICPEGLPVAEALYQGKIRLLEDGHNTKNFYLSAKSYAERGHRFPFKYWAQAETIFWPGCSLTGSAPDLVLKIRKILSNQLNQKVGLVLDCCFDPCFQLGGIADVKRAFKETKENLQKHQVKKIILGCTNCYKIFKKFLSEEPLEVKHVLELIPSSLISLPYEEVYLHHPCPGWLFDNIRKGVKTLIDDKTKIEEARLPACCGAGGALYQNDKLAIFFRELTLSRANTRPIITYCMGCKGRFVKGQVQAYHILEFLTNHSPKLKVLSSTQKWLNRLLLSLRLKFFNQRTLVLLTYLLVLIGLYALSITKGLKLEEFLNSLNKLMGNPLLILVYLLIYTVGPSLFISSLALTMVAGFLWGPFWGTLIAVTGATLGASFSFLLSRYLFYQAVSRRFGQVYLRVFWEKIEKDGWKFVAFLRLFPLFPYPLINLLLGLTPIKFTTYAITSFFFMLPGGFMYTFLGYSLVELLKQNPWYLISAIILMIVFSLGIKRVGKLFQSGEDRQN